MWYMCDLCEVGWFSCVIKCPVEQFLNRKKFDRFAFDIFVKKKLVPQNFGFVLLIRWNLKTHSQIVTDLIRVFLSPYFWLVG